MPPLRHIARLAAALAAGLLLAAPIWAQPRLVVVIVVDQMRASFLEEFAEDYDGGFGRLLAEGAVFSDAHHDYALTETAPGHVTIVTGTYPSRHGVIGNDIWDREARRLTGAVFDDDSRMVGAERRSGRSPRRLERSAIGDWLKAQSAASKVFAVSLKDRTAVFSAGLGPDGAYWYDERTGNFVTSDYYRDELPPWVVAFNAAKPADAYFGETWSRLYPDEHYRRWGHASGGRVGLEAYSQFPHALVGDGKSPDRRYYTRLRLTPFADRLALDFAEALIETEKLGGDDAPDLAVIGLSAGDYIGHRYGPWSDEVHDHYARLDGYLDEFLAFLDAHVGIGRYSVVLTADHGVMPMPERIAQEGGEAQRMHPDELLAYVEPVVREAAGRGLVPAMPTLRYEFGVIFDFGEVEVTQAQLDGLARIVAEKLTDHPFVMAAYTHAQLRNGDDDGSPWFGKFERSFYPERSPDVIPLVRENYLITEDADRTTHGSPYDYDSHVPLIFASADLRAGRHEEAVRTVDIAPTLARLLGIAAPQDLDGVDLGAGQ